MKRPCVYLIKNLVNGKVYVGKTNHMSHRWAQHVSASKRSHHHMLIVRAMRKHGIDNFVVEVLEEFDTEDDALCAERRWIKHYSSTDLTRGYNLDSGGLGGKSLSSETKEKLSKVMKGRKKSPEAVAKVAAALRGRKLSPETRAKMSQAKKGKKRDPEVGRKVSEALKGKPLSEETKAKMAAARVGRKLSPEHVEKVAAANRGRKRTPETLARISRGRKGKGPSELSEEHKASIARGVKAYWQRKQTDIEGSL